MKLKNVSVMVLMLIMMSLLLVSCSDDDSSSTKNAEVDFASNASKVFIHTDSNVLSFNLALFSKQKIENVEFVALEGNNINAEDFSVKIIDNTIDEIKNVTYRGLYTKVIMIDITPSREIEEISFKRIVLNVDGETRKIEFTDNVTNRYEGGNVFSEPMQISIIPNEFNSGFINDETGVVTYEFVATDDYTLSGIRFVDWISAADLMCAVDESSFSELRFPVSVKKGQVLKLRMRFESQIADDISTVQTNIYFDYTHDNEESFNSVIVSFDPLNTIVDGNISNVEKLIDTIIGE